jgi:hypothetical protein
MLKDERRDEVIAALADALLEISQENSLDVGWVEDCARRFDAESAAMAPPTRGDDFALSARQMKLIAVQCARTAHEVKRRAAEALRAHTETIAQARIAHHRRRRDQDHGSFGSVRRPPAEES